MDFAMLPPEINSGLMYSGSGPQSLMDAALAWDELATRLHDAAAQCSSMISTLAPGAPGPTALTQAAAAHIDWLNDVAARAEETATQATSAAYAYELALAAMVSPSAIQANRMLGRWLAVTNCLGQDSPAIADADGDYDQMWAQDVDTMHTYARASADAATVTPFASPPASADVGDNLTQGAGSWTLRAAPDIISAGYRVVSALPDALDALSVSPPTAFDEFLSPVTSSLSKLGSLSAPTDFAINHLNSLNKNAALQSAAALLSPLLNRSHTAGTASGFGRAASIGELSVPRNWVAHTSGSETVDSQCGWGYKPMRLVETDAPPNWPQTR